MSFQTKLLIFGTLFLCLKKFLAIPDDYEYNFKVNKSVNSQNPSSNRVFLPVYSSEPLNVTSYVQNVIIIIHGALSDAANYFYDTLAGTLPIPGFRAYYH